MQGVGKLHKENITCVFGNTSMDLKVRNLNGKNYRLNLLTLHQPIKEMHSKYEVHENSIEILLFKEDIFNSWTDVGKPGAVNMSYEKWHRRQD